jgi:peptide/nickel transport system permease protein
MSDTQTPITAGAPDEATIAASPEVVAGVPSPAHQRPMVRLLRSFLRDKIAVAALVWIVLMVAMAIVSRFWTPNPPNRQFIDTPFSGPSGKAWLGTDDLGRDVFSRLMVGSAVAMRVASLTVLGAVVIAVPLGLLSGYRSGWIDALIMRVTDMLTSVPGIVAAITLMGVLGPGLNNITIALIVVLMPSFVRLVRAQALTVASEPFIAASRSVGTRTPRILFTRVLPGVMPALLVQIALGLGAALTAEASLGFLGFGVTPPDATWGNVLARSNRNLLRDPSGVFPPIVAIAITVLAFNLIGDGMRDSLGAGVSRRSRKRAKLGITEVDRGKGAPAKVRVHEVAADGEAPTLPRLAVEDLSVAFDTADGRLEALDRVSLEVAAGEVLGIVGESGSGKTVTAMSIMRLLQSPPGIITSGSIRYEGRELLDLSLSEMRRIRGGEIAMVFQNPMTSLDPVYTIGNSLGEAIRNHHSMPKAAVKNRAVELLDLVGIPSPAKRLKDYPHNFSGGMRQRVMIAMALAGNPKLLIADEPTTALDVTIQAQILDLLKSLRVEFGMSVILVTHDLGVVADICDRVSVMYAGQVVETAPIDSLFATPQHPYTAALLEAVPSTTTEERRLASLPGTVPQLSAMPVGCRFAPRCSFAIDACREGEPPLLSVHGHDVRCIRAAELDLAVR